MKKLFIVFMITFGVITSNQVKSQAFENGKSFIQLGYGFGNFISAVFNSYNDEAGYKFSALGPMFAKYEYAISDKVGIGLTVAYAKANVQYDKTYTSGLGYAKIDWSTISALARFNLHFGSNEKIDPYWGVGMGYRTATWKFSYSDPTYSDNGSIKSLMPFGFETTFGTRFLFSKNIGAYAEVGFAKAIIQLGLVVKL